MGAPASQLIKISIYLILSLGFISSYRNMGENKKLADEVLLFGVMMPVTTISFMVAEFVGIIDAIFYLLLGGFILLSMMEK